MKSKAFPVWGKKCPSAFSWFWEVGEVVWEWVLLWYRRTCFWLNCTINSKLRHYTYSQSFVTRTEKCCLLKEMILEPLKNSFLKPEIFGQLICSLLWGGEGMPLNDKCSPRSSCFGLLFNMENEFFGTWRADQIESCSLGSYPSLSQTLLIRVVCWAVNFCKRF